MEKQTCLKKAGRKIWATITPLLSNGMINGETTQPPNKFCKYEAKFQSTKNGTNFSQHDICKCADFNQQNLKERLCGFVD